MALSLYLDDCAFSHALVRALRAAGHAVTVPADAGLTGTDDDEHFAHAAAAGLILVTKNPRDFLALHGAYQAAGLAHAGILAIHQDNDPSRDMTVADTVRAVANVEAAYASSGLALASRFIELNHYRY